MVALDVIVPQAVQPAAKLRDGPIRFQSTYCRFCCGLDSQRLDCGDNDPM